jgi:hypothetical protein
MGIIEVKAKEAIMGNGLKDFEIEARWRGELGAQERLELKAWAKKASMWGVCELKIGKERSRLVVTFDKSKIEQHSRQQIGLVEGLLRAEESVDGASTGAAEALAGLRRAPLASPQGLLVKDYAEVLARDWAAQTTASLHAFLPARCQLKVAMGQGLALIEPAASL